MKTKTFIVVLITALCLFCNISYSQDMKSEIIANFAKGQLHLMRTTVFEEQTEDVASVSFSLLAQNQEYQYTSDYFHIASGTPQEVYDKLIGVKKFALKYNNTFNITSNYEDLELFRCKLIGKAVRIDVDDKYIYLTDSQIDSVINKLLKYCENNGFTITVANL